jgi:DNA-binding MarR family transcriptional regulator
MPTQPKLTTSQFHQAVGELAEQLHALDLSPEARAILATIEELNTQERAQKRSHFSMVPQVFWDICKQKKVSLAARAVWLYVNERCDRKSLTYQGSQRQLSEDLTVTRETIDRHLEELATAGLLTFLSGAKGTRITLTDLWSANAEQAMQKAERATRKAALKRGQILRPQPSPSPSSPDPACPSLPSSDPSFPSPSSSTPEGGRKIQPGGQEIRPLSGQKIRQQIKKDQQEDSFPEKDQIRSGPSLEETPGEQRVAHLLALAHTHLPALESYYSNPRRLAEAQEQERQAASMLSCHVLLAHEPDETLIWLLQYIQSEACPWYVRFHAKYPEVPVQLKHLTMPGFVKECLRQYENVRHQMEQERYQEEMARKSLEAWEQRQRQEEPTEPAHNVATDVTENTENATGGDISGHPETQEEENPYQQTQGMSPRMAVYFLREVRQHNLEWSPRLYWAAPGSQVIDVTVEGQRFYFTSWEDYTYLRSMQGLSELPLPVSMSPRPFAHDHHTPTQRAAIVAHNRSYLAKCRALKGEQERG